jgi:hypothetical protein
VRAVLFLAVLMLWLLCLGGAIVLPILLIVRTAMERRRGAVASPGIGPVQPADFGTLVALLHGYAAVMVAGALALSGVLFGRSDDLGEALAWAAIPAWSALMALLVARSLRSPQRVRGSMR